jgi:transcriptional regulator with XRE-family HTH domain
MTPFQRILVEIRGPMTGAQFARAVGVSQSSVSKWFSSKYPRLPSASAVARIARLATDQQQMQLSEILTTPRVRT